MTSQLRLFAPRDLVDVAVIDADRGVADLVRRRLKRLGTQEYLVEWFPDAGRAVRAFAGHRPDVVVLAVSVDSPTSLERVGRLRATAGDVPIVVLHHGSSDDAALDAVITGAQDVLPLAEAKGTRLERVLLHAIARAHAESAALATASSDPVTGLAARWWIEERLQRAVAHAPEAGGGWQVALLFLDLDRFKLVNDTLGHAAGDELLRMVADRLRAAVRSDDPIARFGGDEFVILLEGHRVDGLAQRIALRTLAAFAEPFRIDGHQFSVFASIGLAMWAPGERSDEVMAHADAACYRAKRRGRNRVVVYDDAMREWADHQVSVATSFAAALELGELEVNLRSLVDLRKSRTAGVVARAGWRDLPTGETLQGLASRTGLGPTVGRWLLDAAVRTVDLSGDQRLEVELPHGLIAQPSFAPWLARVLEDSPLDPSQVVLLVGESEFDEPELIGPSLEALAEMGIGVALDGFGDGVSSLTLFSSAHVDEVRLAPGFTRSAVRDSAVRDSLVGLVRFADAVGQYVVAGGVTTAREVEVLRATGVHSADGLSAAFDDLLSGRDHDNDDAEVIHLAELHHPAELHHDPELHGSSADRHTLAT